MKYDKLLEIDEDDKKIIQLLQNNCDITHKEIAEEIGKSQPAVGARILKLERRNLLIRDMGINFKEADIKYVRIHISTSNTEDVWAKFGRCPVILNAYRQTGQFNICIDMVAPSVDTIERFIDDCLRSDDRIMNIQTTYLIDALLPRAVKINFMFEDFDKKGCNRVCKDTISQDEMEDILNGDSK